MGTVITIQIDAIEPSPILDEVERRLRSYEHRFSANSADSELMQVTHNAGVQPFVVDPELYRLIKIGQQASAVREDNLNIAIGPLVQTWRIGFNDAKVPTPAEIKTALALIDPANIRLDDAAHSVYLTKPGMAIDLGALAKGYFADLIRDYLGAQGVKTALINLGGNVVVMGPNAKHADGDWRVGLQDPVKPRGQFKLVLKLQNKSVVTSGIYERQLTADGHTYHHILDTRTGYPVDTDVVSLTIVSDSSLDGELWTTRLFGQPRNRIMAKVATMAGIDAIVITADGRLVTTLPKSYFG
ncbi:thiamin biosynthesis ApbE [Secundilactobacillus kimchicus JCM 15530]|uniref:FAD:protein FMN transferase n=2 Tax=Secundilactobacillus kimchicus TaxID=528209 RepID=A0A0R1HL51_9LACO|nr:thiamin biosynthesis ApbE [Secundilactobacillus kimchicus JCM 15530]